MRCWRRCWRRPRADRDRVPDAVGFAALRAAPATTAGAPAAPWIHLIALTLLLVVVAAARAAGRGRRRCARAALARRFPLPLDEPYFQRLLRQQRGAAPHVQLCRTARAVAAGHARPAGAGGEALGAAGRGCSSRRPPPSAPRTTRGDRARRPAASHALALVDLGATPEAETHGRFVERCVAALPAGALLLLADETAFRRRFASMPERLAQRREAWRSWPRRSASAGRAISAPTPPARADAALRRGVRRARCDAAPARLGR